MSMSDEPKRSRGNQLSRVLAALVVLVSYQSAHYATAQYHWGVVTDALGRRSAMAIPRGHWIYGKPLPQWLESCFRPARRVDEVIGNPFGPERPGCILIR
jgi:hypothetical protein